MEIAIVVPCFNEAARWRKDYWQAIARVDGVRWIFVDDGSTDETQALVRQVCDLGSATITCQPENRGKAEAVRTGMLEALAGQDHRVPSVLGFMDADGAFDPADVVRLVNVARARFASGAGIDAVWSSRVALAGRSIQRSATRHYIGRAVATFVSMRDQSIPYDTQSGFKLFAPSPTLRACFEDNFRTRWLFELELLTRWKMTTGSPMGIWEEPLNAWAEIPGSKISGREAVRIAHELGVVMRMQASARRSSGEVAQTRQGER